jgi:hypothetical protein
MDGLMPQSDKNDLIEKALTIQSFKESSTRLKGGWIRKT